ncbi:MAG: cysteine rich repeat-containing protein [Gammaproteobacteria bacterium]
MKAIRLGMVLLPLLLAGQAAAEEDVIARARKACDSELANYCPDVTPGEGRLMMCLAAHEDKVSDDCVIAVYEAAIAIETAATAIRYIGSSCGQEIVEYCGERVSDTEVVVKAGQGRVLACLQSHSADLSDGCRTAVKDVTGE